MPSAHSVEATSRAFDHAASLLGKSRSDFMLEAACDRAQSVVLDQVFFSLDDEKGHPSCKMPSVAR